MNSDVSTQCDRISIFTIGFTKKSASEFFGILKRAGVIKIIDVRLNNVSQLAGFSKKSDLAFFLREIAGIDYEHRPEFAPTKVLLDGFKKKRIDWDEYVEKFIYLLSNRRIAKQVSIDDFNGACLLCSEPTAEYCHRRLVAEYLLAQYGNVDIYHL